MDRRKLLWGLAALLVVAAAAFGLSLTQFGNSSARSAKAEKVEEAKEALADVCGSSITYQRLKEFAFAEAVRIRNADPANLNLVAASSVVRMEHPVVKSRDDDLGVTVCTGRFVLELPPGAERGFGGQRRIVADVEYAAQAAADGSGLVYQMRGAEPIIYRLAAFDLRRQTLELPDLDRELAAEASAETNMVAPVPEPAPAAPQAPEPAPPPVPKAAPKPAPKPAAAPTPPAPPKPTATSPAAATATARPSFNCRYARSRSEKMVCGSTALAARDRSMSSLYYSAMADADPGTRRTLLRTRDAFLAYRERCRTESCVAQAYEGRMREIRDIMAAAD